MSATITSVVVGERGGAAVRLSREGTAYAVAEAPARGGGSASESRRPAGEVVAALAGGDVAFYTLELPASRPEQLGEMVRLQAEALAPLPVEQLQLAWRAGTGANGKVQVTLAAARRERVRRLLEGKETWRPTVVAPSSEGLVWVAKRLFGWQRQEGAILYVGSQGSDLCVVRGGELADAVRLDGGEEALWEGQQLVAAQAQRLNQDLRAALSTRQASAGGLWVLSSGDERFGALVGFLRERGWAAELAEPAMEKVTSADPVSRRWVYERAAALGLAIGALEGQGGLLDLGADLAQDDEQGKVRWRVAPLKVSAALAAIALAVFAVAGYVTDRARLERTEAAYAAVQAEEKQATRQGEVSLRQAVAARRIDLLAVLGLVNQGGPAGLLLDEVRVESQGQVSIRGGVANEQEYFEYMEKLQGHAGLNKVRGKMEGQDEKTKKQKFTATLVYEPALKGEGE